MNNLWTVGNMIFCCAWLAFWAVRHTIRIERMAVILVFCGALSNTSVVIVNHGRMPVDRPERVQRLDGDSRHSAMTPATRLKSLGDILYSRKLGLIASIGDVLLFIGVSVFLPAYVARKVRRWAMETV